MSGVARHCKDTLYCQNQRTVTGTECPVWPHCDGEVVPVQVKPSHTPRARVVFDASCQAYRLGQAACSGSARLAETLAFVSGAC